MEVLILVLKIAGVLALILLNGFFVAAEFAIVKVRSTQIEVLVRTGARGARIAQRVVTHLDAYLSATQLGITLSSLALGWLGEPVVAYLLHPLFSLLGFRQETVIETISFIVGFSLITYATIVLGELVPRWIAIQRAQRMALALAPALHVFFIVFRPFIQFLNVSGKGVMSLLRSTPPAEVDVTHSEEELRLFLGKQQSFSSTGRSILLNALELQDRTVREVMVPRTSVTFLSTSKSIEQNIAIALENQFTRYPLCEKSLDNIVGMIHLKDLFKLKGATGPGTKLLEIRREMLFVPETMPLERILNTFLAKRVLMAIAVDEYGGTAGLVTLENVLEELVGDIRDEFDVEPAQVQKIGDTEFLVDGTMPLHDFARMFEIRPRTKDVVTVSGYVIHQIGKVPEKGATFRMGKWIGTIEAMERRKVKTIRIRKTAPVKEAVS